MVTLRLVGQHVLVDIATTIYLCEGGGCVSVEGVGGVVKENVCTYIQWRRLFSSGCGVFVQ